MNHTENSRNDNLIRIVLKTVGAIILLLIIVYLGKRFLQNEFETLGLLFIEKFGIMGIFINVYWVDTLIVPVTPDLFLGILVTSGKYQVPGIGLICIASVSGGLSGYWIGARLGAWKFIQRFTRNFQARGEYLFRRYGLGAVILAALSPVPFSTVCWMAGMFHMNFRKFAWATLTRIPRMIIWYYLIAVVWQNS